MADDIKEKVRKQLAKVQGLPTLPTILSQINRMILNPQTAVKDVAQLISSDPAITARVLRIANSSFYGFSSRITTITHAIVILGFNSIKSIVLSSSIFDAFKKSSSKSEFNRSEFWKHSIGCGASARALGARLGYPSLEEVFVAGLLHDVGKIVMDQFFPDEFAKVLQRVKEKSCLLVQAEEEVLGYTHSDVGGILFENWTLARGLVDCARYHHNPALAGENQKVVSLVHMGDILIRAMRYGSGGDSRIPIVSETAWKDLGFGVDQFDSLLKETEVEVEKATIFLDFAQ